MDEIIKIDLFGEEFRFKPDAKVENPEKVAHILGKYIKEAEDLFQNKFTDRNKIAILLLAAMNLSKDFNELKWRHANLEKDVNDNLSSLIEKIDKGIELTSDSIKG